MLPKLKVLIIDDDEEDFMIARDILAEINGLRVEVEWVSTYEGAVQAIRAGQFDACLLDYRLGAHNGLDLLHHAAEVNLQSPLILLTGVVDREIDLQAMSAGASDFLVKGEITAPLLERSIRYSIKQKESERRISRLAFYDGLTNLPNRVLFSDRLDQAAASTSRSGQLAAVLFLDLDDFKRVNDTFGHGTGDRLLCGVAQRLVENLRRSDSISRGVEPAFEPTVGRPGGDEFLFLLTSLHTPADAGIVAARTLESLNAPFDLGGQEVRLTASIGIAVAPHDGVNGSELLKNADTAMYEAKGLGKNTYRFYEPAMSSAAAASMSLEHRLSRALEDHELLLHYQPLIDRNLEVVGFEALLRWQHPALGLVPPSEFVPLAERNGLIVPIGEWVLEEACRKAREWRRRNADPIDISVNVSLRQCRSDLPSRVKAILDRTGLPPERLNLEITESLISNDSAGVVKVLRSLADLGVGLSLDDFGGGYFSFPSLKSFPLRTLKIDRSLISNIDRDPAEASVVRAVIVMAHALDFRVVAEGVETASQRDVLAEMGCDEFQGFLFGKAVPETEVGPILERGSYR